MSRKIKQDGKATRQDLPIADALAPGALLARQVPAGSTNVASAATVAADRHLAPHLVPRGGGLEASVDDEVPGSGLPHQEERPGEDEKRSKHELEQGREVQGGKAGGDEHLTLGLPPVGALIDRLTDRPIRETLDEKARDRIQLQERSPLAFPNLNLSRMRRINGMRGTNTGNTRGVGRN